MPVELVIAPEAGFDIAEAYVWYEGRRAGLGEEFLSSVDACLESIRRRPEMYPVVHESYRRSLIRRFPYAVFYEPSEATVTIYAVFHTSRDPDKWRQRLPR
jgi:plasmid stabilization system protein ParE